MTIISKQRSSHTVRNIIIGMSVVLFASVMFVLYIHSKKTIPKHKIQFDENTDVSAQFFNGVYTFGHHDENIVNHMCDAYNECIHKLYAIEKSSHTVRQIPKIDQAIYCNLELPPFVQVKRLHGVKLLYVNAECMLMYALDNLKSSGVLGPIGLRDVQDEDRKKSLKDMYNRHTDTYANEHKSQTYGRSEPTSFTVVEFDKEIDKLSKQKDVSARDVEYLRELIYKYDEKLRQRFAKLTKNYNHSNNCRIITTYLYLSYDDYRHMCYVCVCHNGPLRFSNSKLNEMKIYCVNMSQQIEECIKDTTNIIDLGRKLNEKIMKMMKMRKKEHESWHYFFRNYEEYITYDTHTNPYFESSENGVNNIRIKNKKYSYCLTVASYFFCYGKCLYINDFVSVGQTMMKFADVMLKIGCLIQVLDDSVFI